MSKIFKLSMVVLFAVLLTACGNDTAKSDKKESSEPEEVSVPKEENSEESVSETTFKDDTLTTVNGSTIKLLSSNVDKDYDNKPMFVILFEYTNDTDEPKNLQEAFMNYFDLKQNTGDTTETLSMAIPGENFKYNTENENLLKEVNPGKTVKGVYMYELADDKSPLTLVISDEMMDSIGTKEYKLK